MLLVLVAYGPTMGCDEVGSADLQLPLVDAAVDSCCRYQARANLEKKEQHHRD